MWKEPEDHKSQRYGMIVKLTYMVLIKLHIWMRIIYLWMGNNNWKKIGCLECRASCGNKSQGMPGCQVKTTILLRREWWCYIYCWPREESMTPNPEVNWIYWLDQRRNLILFASWIVLCAIADEGGPFSLKVFRLQLGSIMITFY